MAAQEGAKPKHSPWNRTVEITSEVKVDDLPEGSKVLDLWIPYPMENEYQEIKDVKIDFPYPYSLNVDEKNGNRMIYLQISEPPKSLELNMSFTIKRFENHGGAMGREKKDDLAWTLEPANLIPLSPVVEEIARANLDPNDKIRDQAKALYTHTVEHLSYDKSGEGWGNGDWQYACDFRKGNCTDFHSYFIGLCRNVGIPAYFEIGFNLPVGQPEGNISGYHCWAYFWDGLHWAPVDISEADKYPERAAYYFGHHDPNRIAISRGRDLTLVPPQKGAPLNYFYNPYAEVDGRKHDTINLTYTFKENTDL
jgi:transglutaminase-like putative cysteine protease